VWSREVPVNRVVGGDSPVELTGYMPAVSRAGGKAVLNHAPTVRPLAAAAKATTSTAVAGRGN